MNPRLIAQLTRAILHDPRSRRALMFYTTLGALLLVALGSTLLASTLGEHILAFLAWWGACAWLLLATVLLALFDLLSIRTAARRARRELAREILARENENPR